MSLPARMNEIRCSLPRFIALHALALVLIMPAWTDWQGGPSYSPRLRGPDLWTRLLFFGLSGAGFKIEGRDNRHFRRFLSKTYQSACLFARLPRRDNSYRALLCACCRSLKTNENPAHPGIFFSGNRLNVLDSD